MKLASLLGAVTGRSRRPPSARLSRPLRVGIFGAGKAGAYHLDALRGIEGARPVLLANRSSGRAKSLAEAHGIAHVFTDVSAALDAVPIDAAIVAVSHDATRDVSRALLDRGVPCLIEKPPGTTAAEAAEIAAAAAAAPASRIAFNRRFMTATLRARELCAQLPDIYAVHIEVPEPIEDLHRRRHKSPAELAQWHVLNSIHAVDLFTLFAGPAEEVVGFEPAMPFKTRPGREDFTSLVRFRNGVVGSYVSHWHSPGRWRAELFGKGFRIQIDLHANRLTVLDDEHPTRTVAPDPEDRFYKPGVYRQDLAFLQTVARGGLPGQAPDPSATAADGLESMRLAEAIAAGSGGGWRLNAE